MMAKRRKPGIRVALSCIALFLAFCMAFLLVACAKRTDVKEGDEFIYCLNGERTGLVRVRFETGHGETKEQVDEILGELCKPSEDIHYTPPIPKGVTIKGSTINYAVVTVDFDKGYGELQPLEEKLVRAAVVQSLLQIPDISGVSFTIEGESLKDANECKIGVMNENDFVQNYGGMLSSYEETTLTLYFADEGGEMLVARNVKVRYNSNVSREKLIVEKLVNGPGKAGGAYATINPMATLLSVTVKDDTCYVNFDKEFLDGVAEVTPETVVYSIVNSLIAGSSVSKVQITVNGEKSVKYMETVDLSQPLGWDGSLIKSEEE